MKMIVKTIGIIISIIMILVGGISVFDEIAKQEVDIDIATKIAEEPERHGLNAIKVYLGYENLVPAESFTIGESEVLLPHPGYSDLIFLGLALLIFWVILHLYPTLTGRIVLDLVLLFGLLITTFIISKIFFYYIVFKPALIDLGFSPEFAFNLIKNVSAQTEVLHFPSLMIIFATIAVVLLTIWKRLKEY